LNNLPAKYTTSTLQHTSTFTTAQLPNNKQQIQSHPTTSKRVAKMPSEAENYKLLFAIISQMTNNGRLTGIDWKQVATDIGIPNAKAANVRWCRFKQANGLRMAAEGRGNGGASAGGGSANKVTKGTKKGAKRAVKGKGKTKQSESEVEEGEGYGSGGEQMGGVEREDGLGDQAPEMGGDEQVMDYLQEYYEEELLSHIIRH
jgi:hypothetical protein